MARLLALAALATVAVAAATQAAGLRVLGPQNQLFGTAIKNGKIAGGSELEVFQHNCTAAPCVVTQIHVPSIYPGSGCPWDWENGRLRLYVDGEASPSISITLLQLAHVGSAAANGNSPPADGSPFSASLFGKQAQTGGVFSTMRIPFGTSLRVTLQSPESCAAPSDVSTYWFIIRGIEAFPLQLGEFALPPSARLVAAVNANVTLQPLELMTLASAPAGTAGALLSTFFDAKSSDYNFLEGCMRFKPSAASNATVFLSSGTEDYFLSASYFDEGLYHGTESGLTYKSGPGSIAAYKTHTRDIVPFQDGMSFMWRNMENTDCPTAWGPGQAAADPINEQITEKPLRVAPATVTTIVWYYVWPAQ